MVTIKVNITENEGIITIEKVVPKDLKKATENEKIVAKKLNTVLSETLKDTTKLEA